MRSEPELIIKLIIYLNLILFFIQQVQTFLQVI